MERALKSCSDILFMTGAKFATKDTTQEDRMGMLLSSKLWLPHLICRSNIVCLLHCCDSEQMPGQDVELCPLGEYVLFFARLVKQLVLPISCILPFFKLGILRSGTAHLFFQSFLHCSESLYDLSENGSYNKAALLNNEEQYNDPRECASFIELLTSKPFKLKKLNRGFGLAFGAQPSCWCPYCLRWQNLPISATIFSSFYFFSLSRFWSMRHY